MSDIWGRLETEAEGFETITYAPGVVALQDFLRKAAQRGRELEQREAAVEAMEFACRDNDRRFANAKQRIAELQAEVESLSTLRVTQERDELRARRERTCRWTLDVGPDYDVWEAECGGAWHFEEGGPEENEVRYCHRCGGKLVIERKQDEYRE